MRANFHMKIAARIKPAHQQSISTKPPIKIAYQSTLSSLPFNKFPILLQNTQLNKTLISTQNDSHKPSNKKSSQTWASMWGKRADIWERMAAFAVSRGGENLSAEPGERRQAFFETAGKSSSKREDDRLLPQWTAADISSLPPKKKLKKSQQNTKLNK